MVNQIEVGAFISKCRKAKKLTQAQLAEELNITDRAISKWETGKSLPDSSIMLELCDILGITVNELLKGEREDREPDEEKKDEHFDVIKGNGENRVKSKKFLVFIFSALFMTAAAVCLICDIAISGGVTWSLIPAVSIVFGWAVCLPGIRFGKKGIVGCFVWLSALIIPYLFVLSRLIKVGQVFTIGGVMAVISIVFLWMVIGVFRKMGSRRKPAAFGVSYLLTVLFVAVINLVLSKMIGGPVFHMWDWAAIFMLLVLAGVSFGFGGRDGKTVRANMDGRDPVEY